METKKIVARLRDDLLYVGSVFQDKPALIEAALVDRHMLREFERLVGDLFSLIEVIENEADGQDQKAT